MGCLFQYARLTAFSHSPMRVFFYPLFRLIPLLFLAVFGLGTNFQLPIKIEPLISGTFGELRYTHFHAGLDFRTEARTGIPIYAAAEGYVYRVRVSHTGYGKVVYIKHPGGEVTVYGHLERFRKDINDRVTQRQYARKQFNQELFFDAGKFPVKAGDLIGYSGNTGASGGPHLHFEIRGANGLPQNPMRYYRDKIRDDIPPFLTRFAIQPLSADATVNGKPQKAMFHPNQQEGRYRVPGVINVHGEVGVEFTAYDRLNGSGNYNGFYAATLKLDGEVIYRYKMDQIGFGVGHYMYSHLDYSYFRRYTAWLQKGYVEPANKLNIYSSIKNRGVIQLEDNDLHKIELILEDYHQNTVRLEALLRRVEKPSAGDIAEPITPGEVKKSFRLQGKYLIVTTRLPVTEREKKLSVEYSDGSTDSYQLHWSRGNRAFCRIPLAATRLPERIKHPSWASPLEPGLRAFFEPGKSGVYEDGEGARVFVPKNGLLEPMAVQFNRKPGNPNDPQLCSDIISVGEPGVPLFKSALLRIPKNKNAANYRAGQVLIMKKLKGGGYSYQSANANGVATLSNFGSYCLYADTDAPVIKPLNFRSGDSFTQPNAVLDIRVADRTSKVNPYSVSATLNGQWTLLEYHAYQDVAQYYLPEDLEPGDYTLRISAADIAGNTQQVVLKFTFRP